VYGKLRRSRRLNAV
jgi:hypothetical protein